MHALNKQSDEGEVHASEDEQQSDEQKVGSHSRSVSLQIIYLLIQKRMNKFKSYCYFNMDKK